MSLSKTVHLTTDAPSEYNTVRRRSRRQQSERFSFKLRLHITVHLITDAPSEYNTVRRRSRRQQLERFTFKLGYHINIIKSQEEARLPLFWSKIMEHYKKLFKSFYYAFDGIFRTIRDERNMRIHLTCMVYMFSILALTDWFVLNRTDWAVLVLACGAVISGEIVNTAVENAVNLQGEEHTRYGQIAKDAAAGAVLVSAICAVVVGLFILLQPEAFKAMFAYFGENIPMLILTVLSLIPATAFIFLGFPGKGRKQ